MFDWERMAVWLGILLFCMFFWYYGFKFGHNLVIKMFGG